LNGFCNLVSEFCAELSAVEEMGFARVNICEIVNQEAPTDVHDMQFNEPITGSGQNHG
jgi:hypothetical protein